MNCMQFNETDQQVKLEFKDVSYFSSGEGGNVSAAIAEHNSATDAHSDIRLLIQGLSERLSALADSDDTTLDQLSEIVAYIKSNRDLISAITADKVSVADIVDNLTTNVSNKPLSAAQGVALKALIDAITVPTALSDLTDDTTHRVVTDAEKATWNAKSNFNGSYNDLTDKPTIPEVYTLPIASPTVLGGVQPVAKTDEMTQTVGVDAAGALWTKAGSGESSDEAFKLIIDTTLTEDVSGLIISEDINGDPFSLKELILFVVQPPIVGQTSNNKISFHPNGGGWGAIGEVKIKNSPKETENTVYSYVHLDTVMGRENVRDVKVSSNYSSVRDVLVDSHARTDYSSPYSVKVNAASDELRFGESPFTSVKFNGLGGPIFGSGTRILMWGKTA